MKIKRLFRRSLSLIITLLMLLTYLPIVPITAFAYDPNAGQGTGNKADSVSGGGWSSEANQGYRVSLLSGTSPFPVKTGKPTVVDILYTSQPSGANMYWENRLGQSSTKSNMLIGSIPGCNAIPYSILWGGSGFEANGDAVRNYLLGGSGSSGGGQGSSGGSGPSINWGGTTGGGGGGSASSSDIL